VTILTSKNLPVGSQPPPEKETDKDPSAVLNVESTPPVAAAPPGGDDMKEVFILDNAPVAEPDCTAIHSKPGIYLTGGGEMTVEVIDGRYVLDEKDPARRQMLRESLLKAGFRLGPTFPDDEGEEPKKARKPAKAREKFDHAIELVHPDNTPGNLINAKVRAAGKRVKVEDGIVKTDDPKVLKALQKKGYIVQNPHTLERETDDDGKELKDAEEPIIPDDQEPQEPIAPADPEDEGS